MYWPTRCGSLTGLYLFLQQVCRLFRRAGLTWSAHSLQWPSRLTCWASCRVSQLDCHDYRVPGVVRVSPRGPYPISSRSGRRGGRLAVVLGWRSITRTRAWGGRSGFSQTLSRDGCRGRRPNFDTHCNGDGVPCAPWGVSSIQRGLSTLGWWVTKIVIIQRRLNLIKGHIWMTNWTSVYCGLYD